jgi:acyl-CoA reductase-like NAD-dependent aldehyde dehydrogenase
VVLFTGPYELGEQIKRDSVDPLDKTLVMEMGGKNPAIICEDADLDLAIRMTLVGAYQTCGQRSTSTSRLFLQRKIAHQFLDTFHNRAKQLVVGNPFEEKDIPFMGSLIHPVSIESYLKFQGMATREGAECVMRGKALEMGGYYVSFSIHLFKTNDVEKIKKSVFQQTELFGPSLSVYLFDEAEEALALAHGVDYSLTASVFTQDRKTFDYYWEHLKFGNLHWNLPTIHQDIRLPFGSVGKSGNGLFTGHQLAASLVRPVGGVLKDASAAQSYAELPGLF